MRAGAWQLPAGALVLGRWLSSLVFEISPSDPRLLGATALLLTMTGLLSAWLPARRASRVEPRVAMLEERAGTRERWACLRRQRKTSSTSTG